MDMIDEDSWTRDDNDLRYDLDDDNIWTLLELSWISELRRYRRLDV